MNHKAGILQFNQQYPFTRLRALKKRDYSKIVRKTEFILPKRLKEEKGFATNLNEKDPKNITSFSSSEPCEGMKKSYDTLFRDKAPAEVKARLKRVKSKRPFVHRFEQETISKGDIFSDSSFIGESEDASFHIDHDNDC